MVTKEMLQQAASKYLLDAFKGVSSEPGLVQAAVTIILTGQVV